jgi:transcriptional regulator with XRE-family HTH domain
MNVGQVIKTLRLKRKIRQQELAEATKMSQSYLSLVEKGEREPGFELINEIARVLKVPPYLILFMACKEFNNSSRFKKPLKNITAAIDDILRTV